MKKVEQYSPVIKSDSIRIQQVLLNLVSNALKFTSEGEINIYARISRTLFDCDNNGKDDGNRYLEIKV